MTLDKPLEEQVGDRWRPTYHFGKGVTLTRRAQCFHLVEGIWPCDLLALDAVLGTDSGMTPEVLAERTGWTRAYAGRCLKNLLLLQLVDRERDHREWFYTPSAAALSHVRKHCPELS